MDALVLLETVERRLEVSLGVFFAVARFEQTSLGHCLTPVEVLEPGAFLPCQIEIASRT
jgi:hypothetical protein